ncbi:MAG: hypothetical protein HY862_07680 [Chloroflexi bacterium]|nr:hypothetical protein [Chloroflexota bacterium]
MDIQQAMRMIEWLDEERRRDKTTIAKLEERLVLQQETLEQLTRQMNGMENDLVTARTQFIPAERDAEMMEQMRLEMRQIIEGIEAKRLAAEREAERRNEFAREMMSRPIRELNERLDRLEHQQDDLGAARAERDRMAASLSAVQQRVEDIAKKIEEPERRIAFLEEQRRQDNRRISDVQAGMPEMQKLIDGVKLKIERVENLALTAEKRITESQTGERMRREEMQNFIDQQNLITQQRDQQIKDLTRNLGAYDEDIRRNLERFESWAETYRQMKKIVEDFERIGERLERRINEVSEMQRLSEERFREEWNDWVKDDQRRWKQFTLTNDEAWRKHEKDMVDHRKTIEDTRGDLTPMQSSLDRLWRLEQARARMYIEGYKALMMEYNVTGASAGTGFSTTTGTMPAVSLPSTNGDNSQG